jgi:hypothetical protein
MESNKNRINPEKKVEKYLIYFTNQHITDVVADDWRVRESKFLCFFLDGREVFIANFNNIYGFCPMEVVSNGRKT